MYSRRFRAYPLYNVMDVIDVPSPFVILVFSGVMLVALVLGSISLLWTVGETKLPSTLTLAVGHSKRD